MPTRICVNCGKEFKKKDVYEYHINPLRKKPCVSKMDICLSTVKFDKDNNEDEDKDKDEYIEKQIFELEDYSVCNSLSCIYCNKKFSSLPSLSRHVNHYCKDKVNFDIKYADIFKKIIKKHEKEREHWTEMNKKIIELEEQIKILKKSESNTIATNTTTDNANNNSNSFNNNSNNKTINQVINVVSFGKDDFSNIDKKLIIEALNKGYDSIPYLIEKLHFNKDSPEHHNMYIAGMKDSNATICNEENWLLKDKQQVLSDAFEGKKEIIDEHVEKKEIIEHVKPSKMRAVEKLCDEEDPEYEKTKKKTMKEIERVMYSNKDIVIETRKKMKKQKSKKS